MKYLVTLEMETGRDATLTVIATNKSDAEYRAAYKAAETIRNDSVVRVIACRPTT